MIALVLAYIAQVMTLPDSEYKRRVLAALYALLAHLLGH